MPDNSAPLNRDFCQEIVGAFAINEAMNQLLLEHLDGRAWRAEIPGHRGRTIAAIYAHVHNIRRKWLRLSSSHLKLPPELDHRRCTQKQTQAALAKSGALCCEMLKDALETQNRVKSFHRDGWARRWHPGAAMFAYMITHDAHHRGQVCMLAHQLGFPLAKPAAYGMWGWESLARTCGFRIPGPSKTKRPARGRARQESFNQRTQREIS
ncbi:MAG: DinB family protein [Acidobacteriaceae bacterium]|nr:DinB family protein [Acidobacteriaceae bacterium]